MHQLLKNIDHLIEAPNGIDKLRQTVLQLAVQGKLVEQNPNDEPASELLKKIKSEKEKLLADGKIKKQNELPPIKNDAKPFELPKCWSWERLENLFYPLSSKNKQIQTKDYLEVGAFPIIGQGIEYITGYSNDKTKLIYIDSPVIVFGDHTREVKFIDFNFIAGADGTKILVPYKSISAFYFYLVLRSYNVESRGYARHYNKLLENLFPLPPLAEQHRIVEKVNELMKLIDELEKKKETRDHKKILLNNSSLDKLLRSKTEEEQKRNWQTINTSFNTLYSVKENVVKLKQAILQLAVQGKLVEQDPNDEPASELIKKIKAEKEKLITEGKIKKQLELPPIKEEEKPFDLPNGWEWVRLGDLSSLITKGSSPKWQGVDYVDKPQLLFITSENVDQFCLKLNRRKYVEWKFNEIEPRSILKKGDFLMNIVGASIGRTAIYNLEEVANINQAVCMIRMGHYYYESDYFLLFFNSPLCLSFMFDKQVEMARPNLSMSNIAKFTIALPPLAEQKRIVEKVTELMSLCNKLEQNLTLQTKEEERLVNAVINKIN